MNIVFFGSAGFAVPSLRALFDAGYNLTGVVTAPDRVGGRGRKQILETPIKKFALEQSLNILQPKNLKSKKFIKALRACAPDLQVVVAFRMLPEMVWAMPPRGTFNIHASLLPKYRGAAPINWAIINGESETGCTSFFIDHKIDTGAMIFQNKTEILPNETASQLHDRLMLMGAELSLKTIHSIENDSVTLKGQVADHVSHAPKIFKEDCEIDFQQSTMNVYNFIRGMARYPAAWTLFDGKMLKILDSRPNCMVATQQENDAYRIIDNRLFYFTLDGAIEVLELQMSGKRAMKTAEFIRGLR